MKLLDLFSGAGGAGEGYRRAGFDVTGVDIEPHHYPPGEFIQADALDILNDRAFLEQFDVVHASPPCQAWTSMANRNRLEHPKLIVPTREALLHWGGVYVIENVVAARRELRYPILLHGGIFGLGVDRPRLFETNAQLLTLPLGPKARRPVGVYGKLDGRRLWTRSDGTELRAAATLDEARTAMGIDWMKWPDLIESIPPAYTEWIGLQLAAQIQEAAA